MKKENGFYYSQPRFLNVKNEDYKAKCRKTVSDSFYKVKLSETFALPQGSETIFDLRASEIEYWLKERLYPEVKELRFFIAKRDIAVSDFKDELLENDRFDTAKFVPTELVLEAGNYCEQSPVLLLLLDNKNYYELVELANLLPKDSSKFLRRIKKGVVTSYLANACPCCVSLFVSESMYENKLKSTSDEAVKPEDFFRYCNSPKKKIKFSDFPVKVEDTLTGILNSSDTITENETNSVINDLKNRGLDYFSSEVDGSECPVIIKRNNVRPVKDNEDIMGAFIIEHFGKCHIELYCDEILSTYADIIKNPDKYPNPCSLKDLFIYVLAHEMMHAFHYSIISLNGGLWDDLNFGNYSGIVYETVAEYFSLSYCANSNLNNVETIFRYKLSQSSFPRDGGYSGALRVKSDEQFKQLIDLSTSDTSEAFEIIDKSV